MKKIKFRVRDYGFTFEPLPNTTCILNFQAIGPSLARHRGGAHGVGWGGGGGGVEGES